MSTRKLNILIVSAEVAPFAKVGGLADVAGALPKALKALGHDVRVAMPCYKMIEDNPEYHVQDLLPPFPVPIHDRLEIPAHVRLTYIAGSIPVYLIANSQFFSQATESKKIYSLEPEPYVFFDRAIAEFVPRLSPAWKPDVIHCNDWHTGLTPVYLQIFYAHHPTWCDTARIFTIHNLAFQGEFDIEVLRYAGLPDHLFTYDKLEFYGRMSFMKGGLVFSDISNTVSKTYAAEVQTPEFGCRLDGLLRYLASQGRFTGILNGIDYEEYNPATDTRIAANYSAEKPAGKAHCKSSLQEECGFTRSRKAALIGLISRLSDQKGLDLICDIAKQFVKLPIQFVLLGTGDPLYEQYFRELEKQYPRKVRAFIGFDVNLAQRIYAGCDMFLMPSRFEPCGLGQMISLRYGTIPIVRATGGLADTVSNFNPRTGRGNGFVFKEYKSEALYNAIVRAIETFGNKEQWNTLVQRALRSDFSWSNSARKYVELYRQARSEIRLVEAA
jgi:starch synthase